MEDYVLHRSMFSEEEQQKLMAALQSYHIADPQDVDSLLTKLSSTFSAKLTNWIDVDFVDWGIRPQCQSQIPSVEGCDS